jgi:hypothetical protein
MQPCHVCGGMAVDQNGYCTQCGTYRGQVAQPVSGAPYPPHAGYEYQVPAASYQQAPASGAPWPSQTSAAPYPFSGPPVSGTPGSVPPAPPANKRPLFGVLIASSAVLVVLVGAIVVVAIVRSGGKHAEPVATGTPTISVTDPPSAAIDPCLVGTWKATSEHQRQEFPSIGRVDLAGQGEVSHVHPDGRVEDDYSQATPYAGSYGGHSITMTVTGTVHSRITTAAGTLSFHDVQASGSVTVKVDGTVVGSPVPLSMSNDPVQYTCTGKTATEHTDDYDVSLTKINDQP